jgi:hypothetical protein
VLASILLIREDRMLIPVLVVTSMGVFLGARQLRYEEFSGGWFGLRLYLRRRHVARAEQCIQRASQSLQLCGDFRSICQVLKENLQPIGIDGIRLKVPADDSVPPSCLRPLHHDSDGHLRFSWSRRRNSAIVWQHSLRLPSVPGHSTEALVFQVKSVKRSYPDPEIFSNDFKMTLCTALERATSRIDMAVPMESHNRPSLAPNSLADSA